jgi:hypothetical protein
MINLSQKINYCNEVPLPVTRYSLPDKRGVAALLTIVVVGAAALIMAYTASILGLGELDLGYTSQQGGETFSIADGCVEEALRHLRIDDSYAGETLNLGDGSCIISIATDGNDRTIDVTANIGAEYYKSLQVEATLSADSMNTVTINSWEEV